MRDVIAPGLESSIVEIESRQTSRDVISGQSCPLKLWEDFEVLPSYMCKSKLSKQAMCTSKLCMQHAAGSLWDKILCLLPSEGPFSLPTCLF